LDPDARFAMPKPIIEHTRRVIIRNQALRDEWEVSYAGWRAAHGANARLFDRLMDGRLPEAWPNGLPDFAAGSAVSTRVASGKVITALAKMLPELWGGSADLAESNMTTMVGQPSFRAIPADTGAWPGGPGGRVLHFGIREHAMGQILNGIVLHGPTRAFGGTFLVFSDYMRPAVRAAALMGLGTIFVWTHDSIGVGEDGPTHQPIEQVATLRAIPGLAVVRPADANETAWAWHTAIERPHQPCGLILSRQNLPVLARADLHTANGELLASAAGTARGAYILAEPKADLSLDVILIASGSEVHPALAARQLLAADAVGARVVSVPCWEWFAEQSSEYQELVLPSTVRARVSIEAGSTLGWREKVGEYGRMVGIDHFGAGASGDQLMERFGFTGQNIAAQAKESIRAARGF
jgi:transketolase